MQFLDLRLIEPLLRAVGAEGYTTPTPIQEQAIPHVLAGRDIMGVAQTGTGKTAAFALPILQRLAAAPARCAGLPRCLVLAPTRELATQIGDSFRTYGKHLGMRHTVIFGGVGQNPQVNALRSRIDIVIATPGRLLDLMNQGFVRLEGLEVLVLDEADRMLDMGFIHDVRKITAKVPAQRQTLMFSATMPPEIRSLAATLLRKPAEVRIAATSAAADTVQQSVYHVDRHGKPALLTRLLGDSQMSRTLVFTRTKRGADRLVKHLRGAGILADAIHGNKKQNARERALASFKSQRPPVLVATDIASRGIDVDDISHVVNYDMPLDAETYVHRIGRTGRAGATGQAYSLCAPEERDELRAIERLLRQAIPVGGSFVGTFKAPPRSAQPADRPRHEHPRREDHRAPTSAHAPKHHAAPKQHEAQNRHANGGVIATATLPRAEGFSAGPPKFRHRKMKPRRRWS